MKIGVISDTHGDKQSVLRGVKAAQIVDEWIHLGDFISDSKYLQELTGLPVHAVKGNCDGPIASPFELVVSLGGVDILITHGHEYDVNSSLQRLIYRACELNCAAALFGHTHKPHLEKQGDLIVLNPGSAFRPIGCKFPSVAVLTIQDGRIIPEIITF